MLLQRLYLAQITLLRKEDNDWVTKCIEDEVEGARPRGRRRKLGERLWKKTLSHVAYFLRCHPKCCMLHINSFFQLHCTVSEIPLCVNACDLEKSLTFDGKSSANSSEISCVVTPRGRKWTHLLSVLGVQCPLQMSLITQPWVQRIRNAVPV